MRASSLIRSRFIPWRRCATAAVVLVTLVACRPELWAQAADPVAVAPRPGGIAPATPIARDPIFVYNNWSAYDEVSDNIPLTEQLAMKELDQILRLRRLGVRFDYYMMDAFWFDPDGGYRTWRKPSWPNGPDAWIERCRQNGILPGLWFSTNTLVKINAIPDWQSSLNENKGAMSFSEGGFLPNFLETLQYWYDRGIRMYKFDFVGFGAATPATVKSQSPEQIRERNVDAFRNALKIPASGGRDFAGNPVPSCGGVDRGAFEATQCRPSGGARN